MPLDRLRMEAKRIARGRDVGLKAIAPPKSLDGSQELAAAANAVLVSLADSKDCRVCGGASWLGPHDRLCPIPALEAAVRTTKCFATPELELNAVVRKSELGEVTVHGIPWNRWIFLNAAQRIDVISRSQYKPRAVKITCKFCSDKTFIVTPLKHGQRIDTCYECWTIASRPLEDVKTAAKEALAKSCWARSQRSSRAVHRLLAQKYARRAAANVAILKEAKNGIGGKI